MSHPIRFLSSLLVACAVLGVIPAAAQPDPVPFVQEKSLVREGARLVGVGGSAGLGFVVGDRPYVEMGGFTFDGAFELRLFPSDHFSFDFQFDVAEAIADAVTVGEGAAIHFKTYFHFHLEPQTVGYLSVAPLVGLRAYPGPSPRAVPEVGTRLGAEMQSREGTFSMGVYARPLFQLVTQQAGDLTPAFEMVLELTWIGYKLAGE